MKEVYCLLKIMLKIITVVESIKYPGKEGRKNVLMIKSVELNCLGSNTGLPSKKLFFNGQFD